MRSVVTKFIIAILFVIGILIYWIQSGRASPTFKKIDQVAIQKISLNGVPTFQIRGEILMNNPNPIPLQLSQLDFDVSLKDQLLAKVRQEKNIKISALSDFTVPFVFDINIQQLSKVDYLNNLLSSVLSPEPLEIICKGNMRINVLGFNHEVPILFGYPLDIGSLLM